MKRVTVLAGLVWLVIRAARRRLRFARPVKQAWPLQNPVRASVAKRRLPSWRRWVGYVLLPLTLIAVSIVLADRLLQVRQPPGEGSPNASVVFGVDGGIAFQDYNRIARNDRPPASDAPEFYERGEVNESLATELAVKSDGCHRTVHVSGYVALDPRWMAAVQANRHKAPLRLETGWPRVKSPIASFTPLGHFSFVITGHVTGFAADFEEGGVAVTHTNYDAADDYTTVMGTVPEREFVAVPIPNPGRRLSDELHFVFRAPWAAPRGFESCYVRIPSLVGARLPVGIFPLDEPLRWMSPSPYGPSYGSTELRAGDDTVDLQDTHPSPNRGAGRQWTCTRHVPEDALTTAPDCHATVVLSAANEAATFQLLLIVLAATLSGGLVGLGAGLRRLLLKLD